MSKAVMLSVRPQWCEKIASGEKTIEEFEVTEECNFACVTRCRDCANFRQNAYGVCYCNEYGGAITPEDYCSRAVRESEPPAR